MAVRRGCTHPLLLLCAALLCGPVRRADGQQRSDLLCAADAPGGACEAEEEEEEAALLAAAARREGSWGRERVAGRAVSILVSSIGGVGTTSLMRELEELSPPLPINRVRGNDGMKHTPYLKVVQMPPFRTRSVRKILYLHGDPVHAVLSLSRRGWLLKQARKTRSDPLPRHHPTTLREYALAPDDMMQLERHFDSFFRQCDYPVAFLRMSEKTLHLEALAAFLGVEAGALRRHLVPWEASRLAEMDAEEELLGEGSAVVSEEQIMLRTQQLVEKYTGSLNGTEAPHDYDTVPHEIKDHLEAKFRRLRRKYDALPGFKVYQPGDCETRRLPDAT